MSRLNILTWNLYLGADIGPLIGAPPDQVAGRMSAIWGMVRATDFPARAKAIAAQVAAMAPGEVPDVILLQEAFRWSLVGER